MNFEDTQNENFQFTGLLSGQQASQNLLEVDDEDTCKHLQNIPRYFKNVKFIQSQDLSQDATRDTRESDARQSSIEVAAQTSHALQAMTASTNQQLMNTLEYEAISNEHQIYARVEALQYVTTQDLHDSGDLPMEELTTLEAQPKFEVESRESAVELTNDLKQGTNFKGSILPDTNQCSIQQAISNLTIDAHELRQHLTKTSLNDQVPSIPESVIFSQPQFENCSSPSTNFEQSEFKPRPDYKVDKLLKRHLLEIVQKIKTQLPGVQVLTLPKKFEKLTDQQYTKLIPSDRKHVREMVEEDIGFKEINIIEVSIEKGLVQSFGDLEVLLTRLVVQRTDKLYRMFKEMREQQDTLYLSLRNELVYKIHSILMRKPQQYKHMVREEIQRSSNPFSPPDYSFKFSFIKMLQEEASKRHSDLYLLSINQQSIRNLPQQTNCLDDLKRKYKKRSEKEDRHRVEDEMTLMTMNFKNLFLVYEKLQATTTIDFSNCQALIIR